MVGVVVGFVGLPLLLAALFSGDLALTTVVVVAFAGFTALLLW